MPQAQLNSFVQGKGILWFECHSCRTVFNEFQCPREKTEVGMMINGKYVCEHKGERLKVAICPECKAKPYGFSGSGQDISHTGWIAPLN